MVFDPDHTLECRVVNCVWRGHMEFGAKNVLWGGKINLPKGLSHQPFFCIIFRDFCRGRELFDGGVAFPVALRAVVEISNQF